MGPAAPHSIRCIATIMSRQAQPESQTLGGGDTDFTGPSKDPEPMTYVITVHGIGEQRLNETILPVVSRFAEARRARTKSEKQDVVTLGMATGQTGWYDSQNVLDHGHEVPDPLWMQFEHLPQTADGVPLDVPFFGLPQKNSTNNLCFVDMHWADLLSSSYTEAGMPVDRWLESVIGRMEEKDRFAKDNRTPGSVLNVLYTLQETLDFVHRILRMRNRNLDDLIFAKYLGDCQIYTEYLYCRGRAVRRFHNLMAELYDQHRRRNPTRPCRFVIIAHSLGSVLALDSLMYALADDALRAGDPRSEDFAVINSFPLFGYNPAQVAAGKLPSNEWVNHVSSFVTLGSPVDKFLNLWWYHYGYLFQDAFWHTDVRTPAINHYNYCDEQDPVGQRLDCLYSTPAYRRFFVQKQDRVFNRYPLPGVAHIGYWQDSELFAWILNQTVDSEAAQKVKEPQWFVPKTFRQVLFISYFLLPILVGAVDIMALNWALSAERWYSTVVASTAFVATCWLGRKMINLFVYWRQVLKSKEASTGGNIR